MYSVGTHREDSLRVALGPHVGIMDLLEDHPAFIMLPILQTNKHGGFVRRLWVTVILFLSLDEPLKAFMMSFLKNR